MSAYMVNNDTLDLLASVADWQRDGLHMFNAGGILPPRSNIKHVTQNEADYYRASDRADIKEELRLENIASLRARYSDAESMLGDRAPFRVIYSDQVTLAQALGALACYEYQACESQEWLESYAFALCVAIRRLLCNLISNGEWEYERPIGQAQRVSLMNMVQE